MKSDGLDYRGPSYSRSPIEKTPFQGRLQVCFGKIYYLSLIFNQDFLADAPEDINIEAGPSKYEILRVSFSKEVQ